MSKADELYGKMTVYTALAVVTDILLVKTGICPELHVSEADLAKAKDIQLDNVVIEKIGNVKIPNKNKGQQLGAVSKIIDNDTFLIHCQDEKNRTGVIRGIIKKRMWLRTDDLVILQPYQVLLDQPRFSKLWGKVCTGALLGCKDRAAEAWKLFQEGGVIIHRYLRTEIDMLKKNGYDKIVDDLISGSMFLRVEG